MLNGKYRDCYDVSLHSPPPFASERKRKKVKTTSFSECTIYIPTYTAILIRDFPLFSKSRICR